jgi:hypothetical protein
MTISNLTSITISCIKSLPTLLEFIAVLIVLKIEKLFSQHLKSPALRAAPFGRKEGLV